MKITLLFLICLATVSVRSFGAGTITPGGGTIAGGSGTGGIGSNTVYNMIQTYAPSNSGITSAQAATQINTSNTTVFANTYIPQLNGLGDGLAVTNGKDIHLSSEGGGVRRIITSGDVNGGSIDSEGSVKFAAGGDPNFTIYGGENNNMQLVSDSDISFNGFSYTFLNGAAIDGNGSLITNLLHSSTVSAGSGATVTLSKNSDGSTNYQIAATGSGTGTLLPPNALGVLTNNGSGSTNWSTSILGTWIGTATLPATTADSTWPKRTNYLAFDWAGNGTTTNAGNAIVLNGFDSFGSPMFKGTNWPTGGGSIPSGLVTNNGVGTVFVPTPFILTNSAQGSVVRMDANGTSGPFPVTADVPNILNVTGTTNGTSVGVSINAAWLSPSAGISAASGAVYIQSNGVSGANGYVYLDGTSNLRMGLQGVEKIKLDGKNGSVTVSGGTINLIATNAAPVLFFRNPSGFSLPMIITNSLAGRAQPVVQYYYVDAVGGTPVLTASNETTTMKLTISRGASANVSPETNFFTLPITTTNTIWRLRDESTGTGASVGVLTNYLIGL